MLAYIPYMDPMGKAKIQKSEKTLRSSRPRDMQHLWDIDIFGIQTLSIRLAAIRSAASVENRTCR